ncbi:Pycsar system effector family protein [Chitinophaga sp. CB10]|uniref:Pycsar system effector family protein n=1 Tax=Chitinophaga sp. CB10 TaxID=1891659 RepID=UPI0025BFC533|nr:Pycsar system effector family protein [Chitinophaga sp. CB10]
MSTSNPDPTPSQSPITPPSVSTQPLTPMSSNPHLPTVNSVDHGERYWLILQKNIEWLRFSETKSAIILSSYGILFTIFYTNADDVFKSIVPIGTITVLVIIFSLLSIASIVYAFLTLRPRLKNTGNSILYFGHIAANYSNAASYKKAAHSILDDEDQYTNHLTEQIYSISKIARDKYQCTGTSMWLFFFSIGILVIAVTIYFLQNFNNPVK